MGTGGHRRGLQQDLCDLISELQVLLHYMDAWQGTQVLGAAWCSSIITVEWLDGVVGAAPD
jgi:hypothetical protein